MSSSAKMSSISSRLRRRSEIRLTVAGPRRRLVDLSVRRGVGLVEVGLVVLGVLGEAEVDERTVPGVAKCHTAAGFAPRPGIPLPNYACSEAEPRSFSGRATCRGGRSSRPPAPRPPSPGSCPSRAASSPCSAASSARRAKYGRDASGSSLNGGIVISPLTRTGERAMKSPSASGATPALLASPASSTSTRISVSASRVAAELLERRVGGDRVDQPDQRQDPLHLAALQVADEVPGEGVAVRALLRLEVLEPVLADQLDPGLGEHRQLGRVDVLGRRQDLDLRAAALAHPFEVARAPARDRVPRIGSAIDGVGPDRPAWRPVRSPSRRWEKKSSGSQLVHRSDDLDLGRRRRARAAGARPRPGRACARRRSRRRGRELGEDLSPTS